MIKIEQQTVHHFIITMPARKSRICSAKVEGWEVSAEVGRQKLRKHMEKQEWEGLVVDAQLREYDNTITIIS